MKFTLRDQVLENWSTYKAEFSPDGSLREIYVFGTDMNDWDKAAGIIASQGYGLEFRQKFTGMHFPEDLQGLFPSNANEEFTLLSIDISGVLLNCHFFTQEQIEFDLDPAEVKSADQLTKLFEFMHAVAGAVGKDVLMTPEGGEQYPIFLCRPSSAQIEYQAFFNGATSITVFDSSRGSSVLAETTVSDKNQRVPLSDPARECRRTLWQMFMSRIRPRSRP